MLRIIRTCLICTAILVLLSCSEPVAVTLLEELRHANGLAIQRPDGFGVTENTDGFALKEQGALRSPRSVRVMLVDKAPSAKPEGERRLSNGVRAAYTVERHSGGSGDDEYGLTAWRPKDGKWIVLEGWVQTEGAEPGFAVAWAVFGAARLAGSEQ